MNLTELDPALRKLRLSGMAEHLELRLVEAQKSDWAPIDLLSALVEEAVSVGTLVRLLQFEGGRARLSEVTLTANAPCAGKAIADVPFPRDSTVVAIIRGEHLVVPRGDVQFRPDDEVLVLVTPDSEDGVRALLIGDAP